MTVKDFKEGMQVRMIVPDDVDCWHGRGGVPFGEMGVVNYVTSVDVYVFFPNLTMSGDNCDWSIQAWCGRPEEFELGSVDWWDVWLD